MISTHGRMVCIWIRENQSSVTKIKNMLIIYIELASDWQSILFFFVFGDHKKIPEFWTAIFRPNYMLLLLIIIEENIILTK